MITWARRWGGDPGDYEIDTILLPFNAPKFDLAETPDFTDLWPANRPLTFRFTVPLDPDQQVALAHEVGGEA